MLPGLPPTNLLGWVWRVLLAATLGALLVAPAVTGVTWLLGTGFALVTVGPAPREGEVVQPRWYRAVLGALAAVAAIGLLAAAAALVIDPRTGETTLALAASATAQVAITIAAWRALTRPTPRRAAIAGTLAIGGPLVAIIVDAVIAFELRPDAVSGGHAGRLFGWALLGCGLAGGAACLQAIHGFRAPGPLPVAQVHDEG